MHPELSRRFTIDVWRSVMEVHAVVFSGLERELGERHRLTVSEFDALVNIPRDGVRMRELTERVVLSQSATSRLIDRLVRRGLVARSSAADDSRGVTIRLTDAGHRLTRAAIRTNADVIEREFTDHLTSEQLLALAEAFGHLRTVHGIAPPD